MASQHDRTRREGLFSVVGHIRADSVMVPAMGMLDILAAIKTDAIVALALADPNEAFEMQRRLKRLCDTIEVAIGELKKIAGLPATAGQSIDDALHSESDTAGLR